MAVTAQVPEVAFVANGATSTFPFPFKIPVVDDLLVAWDGVELDDGFSVSGLGSGGGGNVIFEPAPADGVVVTIQRSTRLFRPTDYQQSGDFLSPVVNADFDRAMFALQEISAESARGIHAAVGETGFTLPSGQTIPNRVLGTDEIGVLGFQLPGSGTQLAMDLASRTIGLGGALVSYQRSNLGSAARTVQAKLNDMIDARDFGVLFNGADETIKMQAAINGTPNGGALHLAWDTLIVSAPLTVPRGIKIVGQGIAGTIIRTTSPTANVFNITTNLAVDFSDLSIGATVTRTGGSYINVEPPTGYNRNSSFRRVGFDSAWNGLALISASDFVVDDCSFEGTLFNSVIVSNPADPDAGDSTITNSTFSALIGPAAAGVSHIAQYSSGGLRVDDCKFIGGAYHYLSQWNSGASATSIFMWLNNSSEHASVSNIALSSNVGSTFSQVIIVGSHFTCTPNGSNAIGIADIGVDWLNGVLVGGCLFNLGSNTGAMSLLSGRRISIQNNLMIGNGANITGILVGPNVGATTIAPQSMFDITTPYSGTFGSNVVFSPGRREKGTTAVVAASTAYGFAFTTAAIPITFAQPYAVAPSVRAMPLAVGGAISCIVASITTTGFLLYVLSVTNGGGTQATWSAEG